MGHGTLKKILRQLILFTVGGTTYYQIELAGRGYSHWTMFIVAGLAFQLIGFINEYYPWDMPFWKQCVFGAVIITTLEFVAGCIVNILLGWNVWDYTGMPFNLLGQICLPFIIAWVALSAIAILMDDYIRWWFFAEEKPHYKLI